MHSLFVHNATGVDRNLRSTVLSCLLHPFLGYSHTSDHAQPSLRCSHTLRVSRPAHAPALNRAHSPHRARALLLCHLPSACPLRARTRRAAPALPRRVRRACAEARNAIRGHRGKSVDAQRVSRDLLASPGRLSRPSFSLRSRISGWHSQPRWSLGPPRGVVPQQGISLAPARCRSRSPARPPTRTCHCDGAGKGPGPPSSLPPPFAATDNTPPLPSPPPLLTPPPPASAPPSHVPSFAGTATQANCDSSAPSAPKRSSRQPTSAGGSRR